jgi:hypothetical protein
MESVKKGNFQNCNLINRGHIEYIIDAVFHFHTDRSEHTKDIWMFIAM